VARPVLQRIARGEIAHAVQTSIDTSRGQPSLESRAGPATALEPPGRVAYLDRLKLLLVAVIIAGHGAVAYGDLENAWPYQDVQEVQLAAVSNVALALVVLLGALFAMGLFFLMSGLVTPGSLARKGARLFARDRLIRLGAPLLVWTLFLWPGAIWAAHLAAGDTYSFWSQLTRQDPILDTGPMWFAEVLLIYSLAYAAWLSWRDRRIGKHATGAVAARPRRISGRALTALAAGISVATVLVRLVFPAGSNQIGQSHLWQWPQFLAMFGLGTVATQRRWLDPVPDGIRSGCGRAALGGLVAFFALAATMAATGTDGDLLFERGWHWPSLTLAAIEGPLAVGASVWLLALAQRHLNRAPGARTRLLARSAYAAFLLQGVVLMGLMIALRPVGVPAEIKALAVAGLGVASSFALAAALVTRTPLGRIL
jgi:acyltransferase-like protein